jgi:hypothetical protein
MSQHWALFYCAHSAKNITDPKRRASVAQTSVFESCGLTGDPADGAVFQRCVVPRCRIALFFPIDSSSS